VRVCVSMLRVDNHFYSENSMKRRVLSHNSLSQLTHYVLRVLHFTLFQIIINNSAKPSKINLILLVFLFQIDRTFSSESMKELMTFDDSDDETRDEHARHEREVYM